MEGSHKGFSSSNNPRSPLVPISSPSGSGKNSENDTSQDQMNSKYINPKKLVAKHFMSPTMSASSKIAVPKQKILAERNENSSFSDTQIRKTPDQEMKISPLNSSTGHSGRSSSWFIPSKNCSPVSNDGVVADSSLKPHDPFTNYLSPRPKYLRYNPNKRRMIFHREVSENREGKDGTEIQKGVGEEESSADAQNSFVSAEENSGEVDENTNAFGVVEEEDEEEIEEFEERRWSLRGGVLKFLLILFVSFLSKTYISSMNSSTPSPSPIQQAILGFKDEHLMIQKQICEAIYMEVYGGGFMEVEERNSGLEVHNMLMVEEDYNLDMEGNNSDPIESDLDYECEHDNVQMVEVYNVEKLSEAEFVELEKVERVECCEAEMVENDALDIEDMTGEVSKEEPRTVVAESKNIEGGEVEYITEAKTAKSDDSGGYELVKEFEGSDQLKKKLEILENPYSFQEDQTPLDTEGVKRPNMELLESHEVPVNLVDEHFSNDGETKQVGSNILVVAGVSASSIILASLAFLCGSRKGKTTSVEDSLPVLNPFTSKVEGKVARVRPVQEKKYIEKTMTPEFPAEEKDHIRKENKSSMTIRPLSLSSSIAEAPKESSTYIHAPTIELLGEIVIKEVGSFRRKIPEIESDEKNASQKGSKSHPVSVPSQPSSHEISAKDSPSYGSFTDERKILKKDGGKDGESKIELSTPVRRSSRLRNRTVLSP